MLKPILRFSALLFPRYFYIRSILYTNLSNFLPIMELICFLTSKSHHTGSAASIPPFSKSTTINQPQQSTKDSIVVKQSIYFHIINKRLIYCSIFLCGNRIYNIFIIKISYEYQRHNVSTHFQYFCDHINFFNCQ